MKTNKTKEIQEFSDGKAIRTFKCQNCGYIATIENHFDEGIGCLKCQEKTEKYKKTYYMKMISKVEVKE